MSFLITHVNKPRIFLVTNQTVIHFIVRIICASYFCQVDVHTLISFAYEFRLLPTV